jgi:hypothetical protein
MNADLEKYSAIRVIRYISVNPRELLVFALFLLWVNPGRPDPPGVLKFDLALRSTDPASPVTRNDKDRNSQMAIKQKATTTIRNSN